MEHLYGMGESSASFHRSLSVGKETMLSAAAIYEGYKQYILSSRISFKYFVLYIKF